MARYTGPVCRQCRAEGMKLFLKGDKCYSDKCPINRRNFAPGQHGQSRKKMTEYGLQLREKQKVKRFYGISESFMAKSFAKADKMPGITGENLINLLEKRFDNVVFRMGYALSRAEARQLIVHGHFTLNGKKLTIPSYEVQVGDEIQVKEKSTKSKKFSEMLENRGNAARWVSVDTENMKGTVTAEPQREDLDIPVQEHLIVELYSK